MSVPPTALWVTVRLWGPSQGLADGALSHLIAPREKA